MTTNRWCGTLNLPEWNEHVAPLDVAHLNAYDAWKNSASTLVDTNVLESFHAQLEKVGCMHLQFCFTLPSRLGLARVKLLLGGIFGVALANTCHLEPMRGTHTQAVAYVHKDDDSRLSPEYVMGFGEVRVSGSGGGALQELSARVFAGERVQQLIDASNAHLYVRHARGLHDLESLRELPYTGKRQTILFFGASNAGKSTLVRTLTQDHFYDYAPSGNFITGYQQEKFALLDDIDKGKHANGGMSMGLRLFNKMNDDGIVRVDNKGRSSFYWNARTIFVTTNKPPSEWFMNTHHDSDRKSFMRRIDECYEFFGDYTEGNVTVLKRKRSGLTFVPDGELVSLEGFQTDMTMRFIPPPEVEEPVQAPQVVEEVVFVE